MTILLSANGTNDRICLGNGTCKVYDNFHVKRCFKCQKFGHLSERCEHVSTCGYCAGHHETRDCTKKNSAVQADACCSNCKNSPSKNHQDNCNHPAYSINCPVLKSEQDKLKRSIPFYQRM